MQERLEKRQLFYDSTRNLNPSFSVVSEDSCRKDLARCWIYGSDNIGAILMAPLPKIPYQSEASQSLASIHYTNWQITIEERAEPNSWYTEYFLNKEEFSTSHLDEPNKEETLYNYLLRLEEIIATKEEIPFLWERGFSSFLSFLRETIAKEQIAFLELIFPEKMEIQKFKFFKPVQTSKSHWELKEVPTAQIARKISPSVYPIYILTAADIIRELVNTVLYGRQNSKLTAAESLGLCWVCLTYARLGLPIDLKDLLSIPISDLMRSADNSLPTLKLPSIFGCLSTPVSETIWGFLKAISEISGTQTRSSIFQCPEESLNRSLRRVIAKLGLDPEKGKITFKTFLSQPTEFDHRYQPK